VESYGGKVQSVEISAKKGVGVDDLLELLALETGMLDLKAPREGPAKGVVIESELDKGKGALATVLIQSGTLRKGDVFYTGVHSGKVREMLNEQGQKIREVLPGHPTVILGLSGTPQAGDGFRVCKSEKEAREIAARRRLAEKERELRSMQSAVSLANLSQKIKEGKIITLNIILRGDVDGSVEVVAGELQKLSTDEIKVNIILKGVGGIKETDIMLARASGAIIIGFHINPNPKIKASAADAGVEIKTFRVIYEAIDQVKAAMIGMLAPDIKEEVIGQVEIRELFKIPKIGIVAGCYVLDGKIERNAMARHIRDDIEIADTKIETLQRFKDQVKEVASGFDCGLTLTKVSDYKIGDRIEVYKEIEIKRKSLER
jgi:translation initiation factor IF-2